jgi:hypothetical protein
MCVCVCVCLCVCVCVCICWYKYIINNINSWYVHKNGNKKYTREINVGIVTAKARFIKKEKSFMFNNQDLNLSNKL